MKNKASKKETATSKKNVMKVKEKKTLPKKSTGKFETKHSLSKMKSGTVRSGAKKPTPVAESTTKTTSAKKKRTIAKPKAAPITKIAAASSKVLAGKASSASKTAKKVTAKKPAVAKPKAERAVKPTIKTATAETVKSLKTVKTVKKATAKNVAKTAVTAKTKAPRIAKPKTEPIKIPKSITSKTVTAPVKSSLKKAAAAKTEAKVESKPIKKPVKVSARKPKSTKDIFQKKARKETAAELVKISKPSPVSIMTAVKEIKRLRTEKNVAGKSRAKLKIFLPGQSESGMEPEEGYFGELPEEYGENSVIALAVDPNTVFVDWEVTPKEIADIEGSLNLRFYDITGLEHNSWKAHAVFDIQIDRRVGSGFFEINMPGRDVIIAAGIFVSATGFMPIVRSEAVSFPSLLTMDDFGIVRKLFESGVPIGY